VFRARDFAAAEEIVGKSSNEEIYFGAALVPRQIVALWIEFLQGKHPTMEQFGGRIDIRPSTSYDPRLRTGSVIYRLERCHLSLIFLLSADQTC
jgi:hypothetical protein